MAKSFSDTVKEFGLTTRTQCENVHKVAIERLDKELTRSVNEGGRLPYKNGNLQRSLLGSLDGPVMIKEGPYAGSNVTALVVTMRPNQPIWLGYQAIYARRMNYGFVGADSLGRVYNQQGNYFVERAIAMWPQLVDEAIKEVTSGN